LRWENDCGSLSHEHEDHSHASVTAMGFEGRWATGLREQEGAKAADETRHTIESCVAPPKKTRLHDQWRFPTPFPVRGRFYETLFESGDMQYRFTAHHHGGLVLGGGV